MNDVNYYILLLGSHFIIAGQAQAAVEDVGAHVLHAVDSDKAIDSTQP